MHMNIAFMLHAGAHHWICSSHTPGGSGLGNYWAHGWQLNEVFMDFWDPIEFGYLAAVQFKMFVNVF